MFVSGDFVCVWGGGGVVYPPSLSLSLSLVGAGWGRGGYSSTFSGLFVPNGSLGNFKDYGNLT